MPPFRSQLLPTSTEVPTVEGSTVDSLICFNPNDDTHLLLAGMFAAMVAVFTIFFYANCRRANSLYDLNETYKSERDAASQRFNRLKRDVIALRRDIHQLQFQETESTISRILSRTHSWTGVPSAPPLPSTDSFSTWSSSPRRSLEPAPMEREMVVFDDGKKSSSRAREAVPTILEVVVETASPTHVPTTGWPNTIIDMDALDDHPSEDGNEVEMIRLTYRKHLDDLDRFERESKRLARMLNAFGCEFEENPLNGYEQECRRMSRAMCAFECAFDEAAVSRAYKARSSDEYSRCLQRAVRDMKFAYNNNQ